MKENVSIGLKLKAIREEKGLSRNETVERLSKENVIISRETLSRIENGSRAISAVELNALCKVLDTDMNALFEEDTENDLVTLFRKKNFSEKTIQEIEKLQDMIKEFIYQKKLYSGGFNKQN